MSLGTGTCGIGVCGGVAGAYPIALDNTIEGYKNYAYPFTVSDFTFSDSDGDLLVSVEITTLPSLGTIKLSGVAISAEDDIDLADIPDLTFTPATDAYGDSYTDFTFKVNTGLESIDAATMTVDVNVVTSGHPLVNIEAAINSLISEIEYPEYQKTWGTVLQDDETRQETMPSAYVTIPEEENGDFTNTGAEVQAFVNVAIIEIKIQDKLTEELYEEDRKLAMRNLLYADLATIQKCLSINHTLNNTCDLITYAGSNLTKYAANDVLQPYDLITRWEVQYEQSQAEPALRR
jgi:hypothetical protein